MSRAFVLILTHELFNYIGDAGRSRKKRGTHLTKMCAYALTYILLRGKENSNLSEELQKPIRLKEKEIQEFLVNTIPIAFEERTKEVNKVKETKEKAYSSAALQKLMTDSCCAVLNDPRYGLDEALRRIQMRDWQGLEDLKQALSHWSDFLQEVEFIRKRIMTKDLVEEIVDRFIYSFQEIYADLSSIICLELELKYYFEAILISEGMVLDEDFDSILVINRLAVVVYALSDDCGSWKTQLEELKNDENLSLQKLIVNIQQYIEQMTSEKQKNFRQAEGNFEEERQKKEIHEWPYYYLDGVWYEQVKYARTCISKLERCLSDTDEKRKGLKEIRDTFELFKMRKTDKDKSYRDLFNNYDNLIEDYSRAIDEMISNEMG